MPRLNLREKRPYPRLQNLKAEFVRKHLTQTEIARRVGIRVEYLNAILNGFAPLSERLGRDIALRTGIPLSVIMPKKDGDKEVADGEIRG